jgi:hypothetical protein
MTRALVEQSLALDVRAIVRETRRTQTGPHYARSSGVVRWKRGERDDSIGYAIDVEGRSLEVEYTVRKGEPIRERIRLETTTPHFGGLRWWTRCPGCGSRVAILYDAPGGGRFRCRRCWGLTYESAQTHDARVDAMRRMLGEFGTKWDRMGLVACDRAMALGQLGAAVRWLSALRRGPLPRSSPRARRHKACG